MFILHHELMHPPGDGAITANELKVGYNIGHFEIFHSDWEDDSIMYISSDDDNPIDHGAIWTGSANRMPVIADYIIKALNNHHWEIAARLMS